ncbi:uncharacterized protein LOC127537212 [Acanthochromis polyacanthus]|uniref:uncharacterized protein LOC127537212 n=1 Tax=Acanthochromis polyacanthus TaxID=80966 RepID=UPI0022342504|nr:uncharacterized protein LOC127537212 [Acanthochromis polyacanthus]
MSPSSLRSSTEPSGLTQASPEPDPHALAFPSSGSSCDPTTGSLRRPRRVRMLRRSWSTLMPGSKSLEALLEKTKATFTGKNDGQNSKSQDPPKERRTFSAKTLPKSLSHGSVASNSSGRRLLRGASLLLTESTAPRLDAATWRCHGPFSHCFLRRKLSTYSGDDDGEMPPRALFSDSSVSSSGKEKTTLKADKKAEQSNMAPAMNGMSLQARLACINSMKGKTYSLHTGFALARKDALDMISILRSSVGRLAKGDVPEVTDADMETFSQLLFMQAKVLSGACSQMATEYSSPEELLLTLTHSFHTLCCLTQACMSLVEGLSTETKRREVVAKVDAVVMNYVCLLKAAEAASGGSASDQSVNALIHYSATMSAIINTLTHSLTTLLNKKTVVILS